MKYLITNKLLQYAIDELGEEYKDLLLQKVMRETGEENLDHIYLIDLIRLDRENKNFLIETSKYKNFKNDFNDILIITSFLALFMLGFLSITYDFNKNSFAFEVIMAVSVAIISSFIVLLIKTKTSFGKIESSIITNYDIICKWKEIEILFNRNFGGNAIYQLNDIVSNLKNKNVITDEDINALEKLREIRNKEVHSSGNLHIKQQDLRLLFKQVDDLLLKINKD